MLESYTFANLKILLIHFFPPKTMAPLQSSRPKHADFDILFQRKTSYCIYNFILCTCCKFAVTVPRVHVFEPSWQQQFEATRTGNFPMRVLAYPLFSYCCLYQRTKKKKEKETLSPPLLFLLLLSSLIWHSRFFMQLEEQSQWQAARRLIEK